MERKPIRSLDELSNVIEEVSAVMLISKESLRRPSLLEKLVLSSPLLQMILRCDTSNTSPLKFEESTYEQTVRGLITKYDLGTSYKGHGIFTDYTSTPPATIYSVYFSEEKFARKFIFHLNADSTLHFTGIIPENKDPLAGLIPIKELYMQK